MTMVDHDPAKGESHDPTSSRPGRKKGRRAVVIEKGPNTLKRPRTLFDTDGNLSMHNILSPTSSIARSTRNSQRQLQSPTPERTVRSSASTTMTHTRARGRGANTQTRGRGRGNNNEKGRGVKRLATEEEHSQYDTTSSRVRGCGRGRGRGRGRGAITYSNNNKRQRSDDNTRLPRQKYLMANAATPLDLYRNDVLTEKAKELANIYDHHTDTVRELYHLELHQNMLDYNPGQKENVYDERFKKYAEAYNLWESANEHLQHHSRSAGVNTRHQTLPLIGALQDVFEEKIKRDEVAAGRLPSKTTTTLYTGSEVRRFTRQYRTLNDYLASFVSIEDNEDVTPAQAEELINKEIAIRERIERLNANGGFSTRLQSIANRRPQGEFQRCNTHHDIVVNQALHASKLFASNTRHRRNAARKCAKAIERHWELIRTHDERRHREETRRLMRLAKRTAQHVMRKWKLVERVCEARHKEILKEEQAMEGRRHLEMILEHSEQMLGVRMEELAANNDEEEEEEEEEEKEQVEQPKTEQVIQEQAPVDIIPERASQRSDDDEFSEEDMDEKDHMISDEDESEDDDDELNELNADQDLDIEQLLEKYNYRLDDSDEEEEHLMEQVDDAQVPVTPGVEHDDNISETMIPADTLPQHDQQSDNSHHIEEDEPIKKVEKMEESDDDRTVTVYGSDMSDIEENEEKSMEEKGKQQPSSPSPPSESVTPEPEMAQPTGTTLSTTKVNIKIPFLLRGTLREYQHVGLDWLASLYNNGLNGILADEMGLGKTIQTISLLAYLACEKRIWGPHLIVVPTSVILNWEMEFKRWLPGFKILTYYGTPRERKEKRTGWSKENAFHVCITSYQLVIQDQNVFRRKAWQYLVLDEAHHIKNFRSQRWQVLLNFNSKRRLLLTGTPLQNNLLELWSLLYFLMPNGVSQSMPIGFASQKEFQEWFSHPVDRVIEGQQEMDADSRAAIQKLHTVLRPYLLRRLKRDVEKQLPEKHEHVVYCRLSTRQRFLYDDFMSRAKTKETLASGNFLSIINCLMQLRKVCNHPDLFEERPIITSFAMHDEVLWTGQQLETRVRKRLGFNNSGLDSTNLVIVNNEHLPATVASEYDNIDASKYFVHQIARYQTQIDIAESRGIAMHNRYNELKQHAARYDYHDFKKYYKFRQLQGCYTTLSRWQFMLHVNSMRCTRRPLYGASLIQLCESATAARESTFFPTQHDNRHFFDISSHLRKAVVSYQDRINAHMDIIDRYGFVTPGTVIQRSPIKEEQQYQEHQGSFDVDILHPLRTRLSIVFPDKRLLQYDCGKLQKLDALLRQLAAGGHRALIFTQMTRVLDVLESFLNMHGHRYLRLDGATKIEQRQVLTEQFNNDSRILAFILSTRSGGLGINLTGADTVIFYDSDWNPSMDKQCQDRTHRIGQTRDVHIYRFVTEYTIEENIFKKANQKRMLDNMVIQEGEFTNDYFQKTDWWRDLPEVTGSIADTTMTTTAVKTNNSPDASNIDIEQALLQAEDENDAKAAITARNEMEMDDREFNEARQSNSPSVSSPSGPSLSVPATPAPESESQTFFYEEDEEEPDAVDEQDMQLSVGHVDQYMLRFWEREMYGHYLGFGGLPEPDQDIQMHTIVD
ncbi:hypothetical protein K492DRAFT_208210 [Lichtheimia hyalospora FSU 10163]|nr:hypothetical protein K492DRAFT_208210 [Lichtheimia hyalospora FSU 10163]